ncbi:unnamed protein product [Lactuca saligna]|uniref:Replication protein A 70 kDa DNA-binding subunit B/D first OB fold domain-containing protein n=1 Tax=Lactuca saligna TaxID=75948 RepID=A0AA36A1N1_LACSI|nr:unnamed protein product [Lactuca saligna]
MMFEGLAFRAEFNGGLKDSISKSYHESHQSCVILRPLLIAESALPSQQLHKLMDPTEITMINDLGLSNDNYTIKVRIIRLWKQTTWSKPHETRQIGMILMDEEGNKIECTVDKPYVILGKALEEYADVYIHKPTLGLYVDDAMKFVDIQNKLFFQYTTKVNKCIGFNGPLNSFAFANFQDVIDKAIPSTISFGKVHNFDLTFYFL